MAFRLSASGWLASATGQLQTPAGGGLGTTSPARPRLEEIGLDGLGVLPIVDTQLFFLRNHEIHANFFYLTLKGEAVLSASLVSQGVFFPAGSSVDSRLRLPFARIGYRAHWLPLKWGDGWSVAPEVGFGFFNLHYELESPSATGRVDRSYGVGFAYLGLQLAGPLTERLQFEAEVLGSGGINGVRYVDTELRLIYALLRETPVKTSLMLGLRGTWLGRRDSQDPVANDIDLRLGSFSNSPWAGLTFGLRLEF